MSIDDAVTAAIAENTTAAAIGVGFAAAVPGLIERPQEPVFCGTRQGTEICDRIHGHGGTCSWHSDIVINMMAVQVAEMHGLVMAIKASMPPGMVPGL
jgi:hypothetical protein